MNETQNLQGALNAQQGIEGVISSAELIGGQIVGLRGAKGEKGEDGHSPVITATKLGKVTVIAVDSVAIATINDGEKGDEPVITATRDSEIGLTHIYCDGVSIATILDGADGETPEIDTYRDTGVTYITSNGVTIGAVYDGEKGDTGDTGATGADGHSPVITANKVGKVTTVYVDGVAIATINDGEDGSGSGDVLTLSLEGQDPHTGINYFDLTNLKTGEGLMLYDSNHWETLISELQGDFSSLSSVATSGSYYDLINTPTIPDELADLTSDSTHRTVTDAEKTTWNGKSDFSGDYNDLSNKPTIPQDKVFIAEKDVTTHAEIAQALVDGKSVFMFDGEYMYAYSSHDTTNDYYWFSRFYGNSGVQRWRIDSTDTWTDEGIKQFTDSSNQTSGTLPVARLPVLFKTTETVSSATSLNYNTGKTITVTIPAQSGYELVGVVGVTTNHGYASSIGGFKVSSSANRTVSVDVTNRNTTASGNFTDLKVNVYCLWARSNIY